jgi:hypothetical protein
MTTAAKTSDDDLSVQEHCIDLPGETVQCWIGGGTDKLKVILRKHRDVIFDIHLGNGRNYTLETTESDFYNVRDKKLVSAAQHRKVSFKDGERMHLWVGRNFRGALVLKSDEHVIYKVEPAKWDQHPYGEDPKEKPAPIIVAIGGATVSPTAHKKISDHYLSAQDKSALPTPVITARAAFASALELTFPVVCVIDGKTDGMPSEIAEYFAKGGDHSGFSDIDPNHVGTRNWIWGQATGMAAYARDNWEWLRASLDGKTSRGFNLVKAQVHYVKGKVRFYFSGYSNSNTIFGRGGFGPAHDRIMTVFAGAGKTSSTFAATAKGVAGTFKENALVSFIFGSVTAIAEWKDDIHKDGYDLAAALLTTTVKAILAAALTTLFVAAIVWFLMFLFGATLTVIMVGALTIGVAVAVNYGVEAIDKLIGRSVTHDQTNTDGTAGVIVPWIRKAGDMVTEKIHENWSYLMYEMSADYKEIQF